MELRTVYFIQKDLVGWPMGIISAKYSDDGFKISHDHYLAPQTLSNFKQSSFSSLEEILSFKVCGCYKGDDCPANKYLWKLVRIEIEKQKIKLNNSEHICDVVQLSEVKSCFETILKSQYESHESVIKKSVVPVKAIEAAFSEYFGIEPSEILF